MTTFFFWNELFIWFTVCAFRERLSFYECSSLPLGFEGGI